MRGHLGVDFGTSNTVAMLRRADGSVTPLLFDSSPLLASAVYSDPSGTLLTGADAERAGAAQPAGYEPNPKRRIDDGTVWLGHREVAVGELIGAVLARVVTEARRVLGSASDMDVTLTHPAAWGRSRLDVLAYAARQAGLPEVSLVPEPVAAAAYFATELDQQLLPGRCVVVYDLGAGTFDVSVVRRTEGAFEVLVTDGLPDVGGLDLDATVVAHARSLTADTAAWGRLDWPETTADQRARWLLWQGARAAKEQLSRHATAPLHVPLAQRDLHLTRDEFEAAARPHLDRTVELTRASLRSAGVAREQIAGLFLVGGSSRVPLVATLLRRALGIPPTVIDQPELVVARGGLQASPRRAAPAPAPGPTPLSAPAPAGPSPDATRPPSAPSGVIPGPPPAPSGAAPPLAPSGAAPDAAPPPSAQASVGVVPDAALPLAARASVGVVPDAPPRSSPVTPTPPRRSGFRLPSWGWIGIAAVLVVALLLGARVFGDSPPRGTGGSPAGTGAPAGTGSPGASGTSPSSSTGQSAGDALVAYQVTGTGVVDIAYTTSTGAPKRVSGVSLPWREQVRLSQRARAEVHAFPGTAGETVGELSCAITVDGEQRDAKRSVGTVSCATSVGG